MLRGDARVMMVEPEADRVEARLIGGEYACPSCRVGWLRPWGFARPRAMRDRGREVVIQPRRSRCGSCLVTHVLLPTLVFLRRRDLAEVIGEALRAHVIEATSRAKVAEAAGVHPDTLRGWLRRFAARAPEIRAEFSTWAHRFDTGLGAIEARGSPATAAGACGRSDAAHAQIGAAEAKAPEAVD